ncbi:hypothetical protein I4U23_011078 [Adineta vaga]|nr:hypothetical protein I4U23_011078 [Adineta vaga]
MGNRGVKRARNNQNSRNIPQGPWVVDYVTTTVMPAVPIQHHNRPLMMQGSQRNNQHFNRHGPSIEQQHPQNNRAFVPARNRMRFPSPRVYGLTMPDIQSRS